MFGKVRRKCALPSALTLSLTAVSLPLFLSFVFFFKNCGHVRRGEDDDASLFHLTEERQRSLSVASMFTLYLCHPVTSLISVCLTSLSVLIWRELITVCICQKWNSAGSTQPCSSFTVNLYLIWLLSVCINGLNVHELEEWTLKPDHLSLFRHTLSVSVTLQTEPCW